MNYQYRFGTGFRVATRTLYEDGGMRRYYQGIAPALIQGMRIPSKFPNWKRKRLLVLSG